RELIADWRVAAGYRVRKAEGCGGALAELRRQARALVVTEMFMPGTCGAEAIARLKAERPGIVLIAVSGYFNSGHGLSAEAALSAGADRALPKPVKRRELIQAVAELVGPPVR